MGMSTTPHIKLIFFWYWTIGLWIIVSVHQRLWGSQRLSGTEHAFGHVLVRISQDGVSCDGWDLGFRNKGLLISLLTSQEAARRSIKNLKLFAQWEKVNDIRITWHYPFPTATYTCIVWILLGLNATNICAGVTNKFSLHILAPFLINKQRRIYCSMYTFSTYRKKLTNVLKRAREWLGSLRKRLRNINFMIQTNGLSDIGLNKYFGPRLCAYCITISQQ
jgi:hypothetical protein